MDKDTIMFLCRHGFASLALDRMREDAVRNRKRMAGRETDDGRAAVGIIETKAGNQFHQNRIEGDTIRSKG